MDRGCIPVDCIHLSFPRRHEEHTLLSHARGGSPTSPPGSMARTEEGLKGRGTAARARCFSKEGTTRGHHPRRGGSSGEPLCLQHNHGSRRIWSDPSSTGPSGVDLGGGGVGRGCACASSRWWWFSGRRAAVVGGRPRGRRLPGNMGSRWSGEAGGRGEQDEVRWRRPGGRGGAAAPARRKRRRGHGAGRVRRGGAVARRGDVGRRGDLAGEVAGGWVASGGLLAVEWVGIGGCGEEAEGGEGG